MRPVRITMVGFGTFADEVTVDLDGVDVFALVGPTGSGKSTIIDAICFALYGSVPRHDDRRAVAAAVHVLATEAKVSLEFELAGKRYVAVRVVRRDAKGRASTREARLEVVGGDVLAGTAREMEPAVTALLGLDFDQFTRAVVLPQGDFARFLHDKPAARQDLLKQLLGLEVYERMMQRARTLAAEREAAVAHDRARLVQLAEATAAARDTAAARATMLEEAGRRWSEARKTVTDAQARAEAADREVAEASARVAALDAVAVPEGIDAVAEQLTAVDGARAAAAADVTAAGTALEAAESALAALGAREQVERVVGDHEQLAGLERELATATDAAKLTAEARAVAVDAADAADTHMEELRTANAAWTVRAHLHAGDACPVCEHVVDAVPEGDAPEAWTGARDAAKAARATADARVADATKAELQVGRLAEETTKVRQRLAGAATVAEARAALARIDELTAAVKAARAAEAAARRAEAEARAAAERLAAHGRAARDEYRSARDGLTAVGLSPPAETEALEADWASLLTWAAEAGPAVREAVAAATATASAARAEVRDRVVVLAEEATALEIAVAGDVTIDALVTAAGVEAARARDRATAVGAAIVEREQLEASVGSRQEDAAVAATLAGLLDARHFEQWLVAEALERLVGGASARFLDLSGGRFSFAFTEGARDLLVVDHGQGDERRSVRTLSGGETFQASLALALALSDQLADLAADRSARLESIFLDEGFGTLDAETLEVVAATIENLGAVDRMVGIVTHVPELAARMPVQFRVARHGRSATVERLDA
jgi:exonuclease SbcC